MEQLEHAHESIMPKRLAEYKSTDPATYWNYVNPFMMSLYTFSASLLVS